MGEFVAEVRQKKPILNELFGKTGMKEAEARYRAKLEEKWLPIPEARGVFSREFAVDSSSAQRSLSNGVDLIIARALMLGSDGSEIKKLRFEASISTPDATGLQNAERGLRDLIEVEVILENLERLREGDLVLVDGSLYGRLTHISREVRVNGLHGLPLEIYRQTRSLFEKCAQKGVVVAGVSKFSKTRALLTALSANSLQIPPILDVTALSRWMRDKPGFSTPLLLGTFALEKYEEMRDPERYIARFYPSLTGAERESGVDTVKNVLGTPAVAMLHLHLSPDEQPLRVDVPACCVGSTAKIGDIHPSQFTDPERYVPIVSHIISSYGGRDVYNALLYVADHEVKLSEETVDTVYKEVLSEELDELIEYDRSSRRFHE